MGQMVVTGAMAMCSFGMTPSALNFLPIPRIFNKPPIGTITDMVPFLNIMPFGMCTSEANPMVIALTAAAFGVPTPAPCIPVPAGPWIPMAPTVLMGGQPALDSGSKLMCSWAGVIQITFPGQVTTQLK